METILESDVTIEECARCSIRAGQDGGVNTRHRGGMCVPCTRGLKRGIAALIEHLREARSWDPQGPQSFMVTVNNPDKL